MAKYFGFDALGLSPLVRCLRPKSAESQPGFMFPLTPEEALAEGQSFILQLMWGTVGKVSASLQEHQCGKGVCKLCHSCSNPLDSTEVVKENSAISPMYG